MKTDETLLPALQVGEHARQELTVETKDLASAFASSNGESYPDVLSTPVVLGLMERACAVLLQPLLMDGEMTVGTQITLKHLAPTSCGILVVATAEFVRMEGRQYVFYVSVSDPAGIVATGEHARAIVMRSRIEKIAKERISS
jgi:fluoroacetyl-CoA thioesterase